MQGCQAGTCPDEAVCVKFRPCQERLAETFCMLKCSDNGDCRSSDGYRCTSAAAFGETTMDAKILGKSTQKFCSIPPLLSVENTVGPIDAGAPDASTGDASIDGAVETGVAECDAP